MENVLRLAAELMELSAVTAPKAAGANFVVTKVITGDDLKTLAEDMEKYGRETGKKNFDRDGRNVAASGAVLLVGLSGARTLGLNCGACGFPRCADLPDAHDGPEFKGPFCAWRFMDLGIALGSAAKMASLLNVDNRLMYRIGVSARRLGLLEADVICGIPLSASGKSPYFDR
ncbi:MAG: ferredoxin domain-containing protein [Chitinophagales bacterium]